MTHEELYEKLGELTEDATRGGVPLQGIMLALSHATRDVLAIWNEDDEDEDEDGSPQDDD